MTNARRRIAYEQIHDGQDDWRRLGVAGAIAAVSAEPEFLSASTAHGAAGADARVVRVHRSAVRFQGEETSELRLSGFLDARKAAALLRARDRPQSPALPQDLSRRRAHLHSQRALRFRRRRR